MEASLHFRWGIPGLLALLWAVPARAQSHAGDWAWRPLLTHRGVVFSYLFYKEADNVHNGVVLKLANTNAYAVRYRFRMIFRAEGAEQEARVVGRLAPGEVRTGDAAGLFWIPFTDGRQIAEIGLRGYRVTPERDDGSSP